MLALLERLTYVRALALPRHLGDNIHPARRAQFAREGAVAPVNLLSDFGTRRRITVLSGAQRQHALLHIVPALRQNMA